MASDGGAVGASSPCEPARSAKLSKRLLSRRALILLTRNTVVSSLVFAVGLGLLWLLVERGHVDKVVAAGVSFLVANSLHYVFGRRWIYRGTERGVAAGYAFFLINAGIGLIVTVALFAALMAWMPMHYLIARVIVSVSPAWRCSGSTPCSTSAACNGSRARAAGREAVDCFS